MSRRWPVYHAAQAKRAELQKQKDAELQRVLASQAKALAGAKHVASEIPGERINAPVQRADDVQSGKGRVQDQIVSGKRGGRHRKNVERESRPHV